MILKDGKNAEDATSLALYFIDIASQVNQLISIGEKNKKLHALANMIENNELIIGNLSEVYYFKLVLRKKNEFDWDEFIGSLRLKKNKIGTFRSLGCPRSTFA